MINSDGKIPVIVVVGPTASGKTGLGIKIAREYNGEIVSADSMQIYKGFPIASAAPSEEEKKLAVHHLVEFLEPSVKFSVAQYVELAGEKIRDIHLRGKIPVIVGGTGLYINSLIDGIAFSSQETDTLLRKQLEDEYEKIGGEEMLKKLAEFDSYTAKKLSSGDKRRIVRAFEVYKTTGMTVTEQNRLSRINGSPYSPIMIGISFSDREKLYERINRRVDVMLENGLIDEAKSFTQKGMTAAQAIGHKELMPYIDGIISMDDAIETLKRETRRYAKRQLTWFRRDERIRWVYADTEDVWKKTKEIINEKGVTNV
ncbi:MAG: tRNA (adenosine(37)-N6)-dimethylallyltransferase MiaA [Acutalibacteraceae bacterium]|nr:tRNA (adenosine(37)-N6)-dimethylallyltransferase MiaA [Acutalibacteraceae bacterium]